MPLNCSYYIPKVDIHKKYIGEVENIYNMYMDFFDNKLDAETLFIKEKLSRERYNIIYLIKRFAINFQNYAKINFKIENLEDYIIKSELFKKCYEEHINYIDGRISVGQYLNYVEKIKIDIVSYRKIVRTYAENILDMPEKEIEQLIEKGNCFRNTLELIENASNENEIFSILTDYARYKEVGIENGNAKLRTLKGDVFNYVVVKYKIDKSEIDSKINLLREKIQKVIDLYIGMEIDKKKKKKKLIKIFI